MCEKRREEFELSQSFVEKKLLQDDSPNKTGFKTFTENKVLA